VGERGFCLPLYPAAMTLEGLNDEWRSLGWCNHWGVYPAAGWQYEWSGQQTQATNADERQTVGTNRECRVLPFAKMRLLLGQHGYAEIKLKDCHIFWNSIHPKLIDRRTRPVVRNNVSGWPHRLHLLLYSP